MVDGSHTSNEASGQRDRVELWRKKLFLAAMAVEKSLLASNQAGPDKSILQELVHETIFDLFRREQELTSGNLDGDLSALFAAQMLRTRRRLRSTERRKLLRERSVEDTDHEALRVDAETKLILDISLTSASETLKSIIDASKVTGVTKRYVANVGRYAQEQAKSEEIAAELGTTVGTVETIRKRVRKKAGISIAESRSRLPEPRDGLDVQPDQQNITSLNDKSRGEK